MLQTLPRYRRMTGLSTSSQPSALCTLPGRKAQRSRSPNWLNTNGAVVMTVPDAQLLLAMGRADARIHVGHNAARWPSTVHQVDPVAAEVSQCREVCICREPPCLEAAHLDWRSRAALCGPCRRQSNASQDHTEDVRRRSRLRSRQAD